jgi:hypothetical protein
MGNNQMLPKFDAQVTSLGRNQTLSEESLAYRLELGQHRIKQKIKCQKLKAKKAERTSKFSFVILHFYSCLLHFITYDIHSMPATILPSILTSSPAS